MAVNARSAAQLVELLESVRSEPYANGFYSLLRRIDALSEDRPRIGSSRLPADDPVRLAQDPDTAFASSEIAGCELNGGRPPRIYGRAFGLFGPQGALPLHLSEHARNRIRHHRDASFARFVDLFHHRLISLFYRAWASAQPAIQRDRPGQDGFARQIDALFGLAPESLHDRDAFADENKRYFAGHFARQSRDPDSLAAMVGECFKVPTRLQEFDAAWVTIPSGERSRLGDPATAGLGESSLLGARIFSRQGRFKLELGPMPYTSYRQLFPDQPRASALASIVRLYCGLDLDCSVKLILLAAEIPSPELGGERQLGRDFWLGGAGRRQQDGTELHYLITLNTTPGGHSHREQTHG